MGSESEVPKGTWAIDTNRKERNALINDLTHYSIGGDRLINLHKQSHQVQNISDSENSGAKWNNYDCLATGILVKTFDLIKKHRVHLFHKFYKGYNDFGEQDDMELCSQDLKFYFQNFKKNIHRKRKETLLCMPKRKQLGQWLAD